MGMNAAVAYPETNVDTVEQSVPEGYKRTELGVIPEDWDCCSLDNMVIRVGSGITPTGGERIYVEDGRPFIRSQNVGWGKLLLDDLVYITDKIHATFPTSEIKEGDVLLNITGASIGRSAIADDRLVSGNVNQHVCEIRTDHLKLAPKYLNLYLLSSSGQKQIDSFQAGGNRQGLNYGQIKSFLIPVPSPTEQQAIAEALSDVDALIESLEKLIAKKRDIKLATMQQLLTGKTRLPGFSGEWEQKRLGNLGRFLKGRGVKKDEASSGNLPCIRYGEIYTHHNDYIKYFNSWISPDVATTATRLKKGDLLFAGSGETKEEIGKCVAFIDDLEAYAGGDTVILSLSEDNALFLGYYCNTEAINLQKASKGQGDAVVHISANALSSIEVTIPTIPEQTAIADVLSDMDTEISTLEQRLEKTKQIKQGMMQQLLTGKVRLVSPYTTETPI